jgi:hypothetical protein
MNRRQSLKAIGITTVSAGILLDACRPGNKESDNGAGELKTADEAALGRERHEIDRLKALNSETFFTEHEMKTLTVLADIIIPADEVSGSASEAGVPEFIEFIVKDIPSNKTPMRGGLKWLDNQCLSRYGKVFIECSSADQLALIDEIAYPSLAKPAMSQGVSFFSRMRRLTASGFYTSKIGIADIGYMGNVPHKWEGVPADVLAQYGFTSNS